MLPDRVSNPGPLTYESGALPTVLRGPAILRCIGLPPYSLTIFTEGNKFYNSLFASSLNDGAPIVQ